MKIFLYEFATGGGFFQTGGRLPSATAEPLAPSLLSEGRAMVEAMAADLAAIPGIEPVLMRDHRVELAAPGCRIVEVSSATSADGVFGRLAATSDATLLIAPEFDGLLAQFSRRVQQGGGHLIGPDVRLVELAGDKDATARHLRAAGLSVPDGICLPAGAGVPVEFPIPAVIKPRDGAGSQDTRLLESADDAADWRPLPFATRLERFCSGMPASVAVLCGPGIVRPLIPCAQILSDDGSFSYLGGMLPLPPELAVRATRLATAAVRSLPGPRGYIGVDLVLGDSPRDDVIIEINPRLTTSYVGLRAASRVNLAGALLHIAEGDETEFSFDDEPLQFDSCGVVRPLQSTAL